MTESDYCGPATVVFDDAQFDVTVDLRGHAQPIDGTFRWYGRIRPDQGLDDYLAGAGKTATLRTPEGEARASLSDMDFWGRYRVTGSSRPPYRLVEPDPIVSPAPPATPSALDRAVAMMDDSRHGRIDLSRGYADVIPDVHAPTPTAAQRAMNNRVVAAIYETAWRPFGRLAMGRSAFSVGDERRRAVRDLRLSGDQTVLDVACGPGNFTRSLSDSLTDNGIAIGFDISEPMLTRAVQDNTGDRVAYVRGDARRLPYADNTFDAVCCYAALYLVPEPFTVARELIRVLRPGGRVAIMTSRGPALGPLGRVGGRSSRMVGITVFGDDEFPTLFADEGCVDISHSAHGLAQFVAATKTARDYSADLGP